MLNTIEKLPSTNPGGTRPMRPKADHVCSRLCLLNLTPLGRVHHNGRVDESVDTKEAFSNDLPPLPSSDPYI